MKINHILSGVTILGMFSVVASVLAANGYTPDFSGEPYTTDLTSCYTSYNNGIYSCESPTYVLTAWTGSNNPCAAVSAAPAWDASSTASTVSTTANAIAGGGYYFNCLGSDGTTYDNWICRPDSANVSNHIATTCTGLATSTYATVTQGSNTNCLSGYTNCDTNVTNCEVTIGSSYPGELNAVYLSDCDAVCDASHLDCDGDLGTGGTGCEITKNTTAAGSPPNTLYGSTCTDRICDSTHFLLTFNGARDAEEIDGCIGVIGENCTVIASSLPGTCTGSCATGTLESDPTATCACSVLDVPEFAAGGFVDSEGAYTSSAVTFTTTNPLLWGIQNGIGGLLQLSNNSGVQFEIDNVGVITAGFIGAADLTGTGATEGQVLGIATGGGVDWITPAGGSSTVSLDEAYDNGAAITVDGVAISLDGTSATGDIFVVQDLAETPSDILKIDGTGNTTLKQLKLISADTNGIDGKPNLACDATTVGNIAYVTSASFVGEYYGCKQTAESTYSWVALSVFGS